MAFCFAAKYRPECKVSYSSKMTVFTTYILTHPWYPQEILVLCIRACPMNEIRLISSQSCMTRLDSVSPVWQEFWPEIRNTSEKNTRTLYKGRDIQGGRNTFQFNAQLDFIQRLKVDTHICQGPTESQGMIEDWSDGGLPLPPPKKSKALMETGMFWLIHMSANVDYISNS